MSKCILHAPEVGGIPDGSKNELTTEQQVVKAVPTKRRDCTICMCRMPDAYVVRYASLSSPATDTTAHCMYLPSSHIACHT